MKSPQAQAAAQIRKQIKKYGIECKVKSEGYSMGSSIYVTVYDQSPGTVQKIESFAGKYQYGHFDGMQDMYIASNDQTDLPQAKYVSVSNKFSDELSQKAWDWARSKFADLEGAPESHKEAGNFWIMSGPATRRLHDVLNGTEPGFWITVKPRVRAA